MNRNLRELEDALWKIINEVEKQPKDTIKIKLQLLAFKIKLLKNEEKEYKLIILQKPHITKHG